MIQFTDLEKQQIADGVLKLQTSTGTSSDRKMAVKLGMSPAAFSFLKTGKYASIGSDTWLKLAQAVRFVRNSAQEWKHAETIVSQYLFKQFEMCQTMGMTAMLADDPGIGKTHSMNEYARTHADVMTIDCSVSNTKGSFIRAVAKAVGVTAKGRLQDILDSAIYAIGLMEKPLIILDESGDLENGALMQLKKLYNALEMRCGFFMMGSDGFKAKILRGVEYNKLGYTEVFSRFDKDFKHALSSNQHEKLEEYRLMAAEICKANGITGQDDISRIVTASFDGKRGTGDLRRVKREVMKQRIINSQKQAA